MSTTKHRFRRVQILARRDKAVVHIVEYVALLDQNARKSAKRVRMDIEMVFPAKKNKLNPIRQTDHNFGTRTRIVWSGRMYE